MKLSLPLFVITVYTMIGGAFACPPSVYPLIAGGGNGVGTKVGNVAIHDEGSTLELKLSITDDLTPGDTSDDSSPTKIYQIHAEANCQLSDFPLTKKGSPKNGQFELNIPYADGVSSDTVHIPKPDCGGAEILIAVHTEVKKLGGLDAFNDIFPVPVEFTITLDTGSNEGASYWDTTFVGDSVLSGETIDGYCIDVSHSIGFGPHTGKAYNYLDAALEDTNIDMPENMDLVAWAINNFFPGEIYTADVNGDGTAESYTMTSGTLQRAIWYLIDDIQSTAGLGSYNDDWAAHIADLATEHEGYEPGCGDLVPVVIVPDSGSRQHTTIQTTFAAVDFPCYSIGETAWAAMPGMTELGFQFAGNNWATYLTFSHCDIEISRANADP